MATDVPQLRIIVADDHQVVREGVISAINSHGHLVVAEAATKVEAIAQVIHQTPDVLIIDLNFPDGNGIDVVKWARSVSERIALIVLTFNQSDDYILAAMQAGASAFVTKSQPLPELLAAIEHAALSPLTFTCKSMVSVIERREQGLGLTGRELEILSRLDLGQTSQQMAKSFYITESTLKSHLSSIYRKLGVRNRIEAIAKARASGLGSTER